MVEAAVAQTDLAGAAAGAAIGEQIRQQMGGKSPDAVVVFSSPQQDHAAVLQAVQQACSPAVMVGCSSAGEFTSEASGTGMVAALALKSADMKFTGTIGRGLRTDREQAASQLSAGFNGIDDHSYRYRSALVLTDALAGFADSLVEQLTVRTGGTYKFFGGGAGDDANFKSTCVFFGTEVVKDAAVALEILSNKPIGIGVRHGWTPASPAMRVTQATGMQLNSLNAAPASEAFDEHADRTEQEFDHDNAVPFFLHNVLGIKSSEGVHLRVPLGVNDDGSLACAADVPVGATAHIMGTTAESAAHAAALATRDAVAQLEGHKPKVAMFFDCVATRLRLGKGFGGELDAVQKELGDASFVGFNTYGQIARADGQFSGFHNCTAVVCVLPE